MAQMPKEGFLKITAPKRPSVNSSQRAALIRKANALFNAGRIAPARKVFVALDCTDGIIRLGDYYYRNADFFEAYRMYSLAPSPAKLAYMVERMAAIVRQWMLESSQDPIP